MRKLPKGEFEVDDCNPNRVCAICLETFKINVRVTYLPCDPRHHFHSECINRWLCNFLKCPICNKEITLDAVNNCRQYKELSDIATQFEKEN